MKNYWLERKDLTQLRKNLVEPLKFVDLFYAYQYVHKKPLTYDKHGVLNPLKPHVVPESILVFCDDKVFRDNGKGKITSTITGKLVGSINYPTGTCCFLHEALISEGCSLEGITISYEYNADK